MGLNNTRIIPDPNIKVKTKEKYVLGIIDPQNDFFSLGKWAVPGSDKIIGPINKLRFALVDRALTFICENSYHDNHVCFASTHDQNEFTKIKLDLEMGANSIETVSQTMLPTHCVKNTQGQYIHQDLIVLKRDKIFTKGTNLNVPTYSAFGDKFNLKYENTGLNDWVKELGIKNIILVGIGIDWCLGNTAKEAIGLGYKVHIILNCICGFDFDKSLNILKELEDIGVIIYDNLDNFLQMCELFAKN